MYSNLKLRIISFDLKYNFYFQINSSTYTYINVSKQYVQIFISTYFYIYYLNQIYILFIFSQTLIHKNHFNFLSQKI